MFGIAALTKFFFLFVVVLGEVSCTQLADNADLRQSQLEKRQTRRYLSEKFLLLSK